MNTWTKSIWSEPDGTGSSTRIHITAITTFILGIGLSFGVATHQKKITVEQFDSFLSSAATFLVTTCGPLYGINKAVDYLNNKSGNGTVNDNKS